MQNETRPDMETQQGLGEGKMCEYGSRNAAKFEVAAGEVLAAGVSLMCADEMQMNSESFIYSFDGRQLAPLPIPALLSELHIENKKSRKSGLRISSLKSVGYFLLITFADAASYIVAI